KECPRQNSNLQPFAPQAKQKSAGGTRPIIPGAICLLGLIFDAPLANRPRLVGYIAVWFQDSNAPIKSVG
ncbi:MAG: hypothetical protein WHV66_14285, partial [Anaerolineales bacterium]